LPKNSPLHGNTEILAGGYGFKESFKIESQCWEEPELISILINNIKNKEVPCVVI
jgi:hypothetical protein